MKLSRKLIPSLGAIESVVLWYLFDHEKLALNKITGLFSILFSVIIFFSQNRYLYYISVIINKVPLISDLKRIQKWKYFEISEH